MHLHLELKIDTLATATFDSSTFVCIMITWLWNIEKTQE